MGGHINMMDDVLLSNLPPEYLRSVLRKLLSLGAITHQPFLQHVQQDLTESHLELTSPELLFPEPDVASDKCREYLAMGRCLFAAKLTLKSLEHLTHFVNAAATAQATWTPESPLANLLDHFGGDVVQSMQALKESTADSKTLKAPLTELLDAFVRCSRYCAHANLPYPFRRPERQVQDTLARIFPSKVDQIATSTSRDDKQGSLIQATLPENSAVEKFTLGASQVPRLFNGLWQLASPSWGAGNTDSQEKALVNLIQSGLVAADMADHYGDAELVYGDFRNRLSKEVAEHVYTATKWCIFKPIGQPVTTEWVLEAVKERCRRLGGRADLLQFHWYDYESKEYLDILAKLVGITQTHPHLVSAIGLCNFDSEHTAEVCEHLLAKTGNVGVVSNQVQFSVIDSRPLMKMVQTCEKYGLKLLTYGSFVGGFLSSSWLSKPRPDPYSPSLALTPSQRKYLDVVYTWGTWADFQSLLHTISDIANRHGVSVANVVARWVLQQPAVGAVIVGTRLGVSDRCADNLRVFGWELDGGDMEMLNAAALGKAGERTESVFEKIGDCGDEYRAMH